MGAYRNIKPKEVSVNTGATDGAITSIREMEEQLKDQD